GATVAEALLDARRSRAVLRSAAAHSNQLRVGAAASRAWTGEYLAGARRPDVNRRPTFTLLVMAAGLGSRYGGLKQIDRVGPAGEMLLDYAVFDARRAGFRRVVFIIRADLGAPFADLARHCPD